MKRFRNILIALGIIGVASASILSGPELQTLETVKTDIAVEQEAYFQRTGEYMQVLEGNRLPTDTKARGVETELGRTLPEDYRVDVFEKPDGTKGYTVRKINPADTVILVR